MTTRTLSSAMCANALNALDLLDAMSTQDTTRIRRISLDTDPVDLVSGLVLLASAFRTGMAAATGCTETDLTERTRAMYVNESFGGVA